MATTLDGLVRSLHIAGKTFHYISLQEAQKRGLINVSALPRSLRILAENLLRHYDDDQVTAKDFKAFSDWSLNGSVDHEIAYHPGRVLMQDFTGVPSIADLAAMRDAFKKVAPNGDAKKINPFCPVHLIVDHSVQVEHFATVAALSKNTASEIKRNRERYIFLRWGQRAFSNLTIIPPGMGICHQVNLEYIATLICEKQQKGDTLLYPDTLIGLDSHTTMINGLGMLGWGVGGIEAEAVMLGEPISMLIPEVMGVRLEGKLPSGTTATDLVLTITEELRKKDLVGKFVEFYGPALSSLTLAQRATIANMAPEYGATCGIFPVDQQTLNYLELTNRSPQLIEQVEAYYKVQGLWYDEAQDEAIRFTDQINLDLGHIRPSVAGPKRPQDRVTLDHLPAAFINSLPKGSQVPTQVRADASTAHRLQHGDVVIAAITSCTNTSNPDVMIAAGLLAKNAIEKGLNRKSWVKTSLAPGSTVVSDYLKITGLQTYLSQLGFDVVGFGCTTCIGNSGSLQQIVADAIVKYNLKVSAVLSGNRNFEGRVHPMVQASWLASPPLVVAFAIAGTVHINLNTDPLGYDQNGVPVYLKDLWPTEQAINQAVKKITKEMFAKGYKYTERGTEEWQALPLKKGDSYPWDSQSTYIQPPPFMEQCESVKNIQNARILALLGDTITTDHISPAGSIKEDSPAGQYLIKKNVKPSDFNAFGTRRGNHEVMVRGTFANIRLQNEMVLGKQGGFTVHYPSGEVMPIYDAAMRYQEQGQHSVVIAGKNYGTGSSRDWAAKGPYLLGVKAVIVESFERIHRSNLIGMGILPLEFMAGVNRHTLMLNGSEQVTVMGLDTDIQPNMALQVNFIRDDGYQVTTEVRCAINTKQELACYKNGGILPYVLSKKLSG